MRFNSPPKNNPFIYITLPLLFILFYQPGMASALPIATINASTGTVGSWGASWEEVNFKMCFGDVLVSYPYQSPGGTLYEVYRQQEGTALFNYTLTPAHSGQSIILNSGAAFETAVNYLTNGINEGIRLEYWVPNRDSNYGPSGLVNQQYESAVFYGGPWWGDSAGLAEVDLKGYHITSIALLMNNIYINTPGFNPNGDGLWTDYRFDFSIVIDGESNPVPEPATLLLLASGLAVLAGVRRKFNK